MSILSTARFSLRKLTKRDASPRYLSWFDDNVSKRYISFSSNSIGQLEEYIESKNANSDCILWGIFYGNKHIGNIKFEPLDVEKGEATMGILIGDSDWRGKGVATEVMKASFEFLKKEYAIKEIKLGVNVNNIPAIKSYEKLGFIITAKTKSGFYMSYQI